MCSLAALLRTDYTRDKGGSTGQLVGTRKIQARHDDDVDQVIATEVARIGGRAKRIQQRFKCGRFCLKQLKGSVSINFTGKEMSVKQVFRRWLEVWFWTTSLDMSRQLEGRVYSSGNRVQGKYEHWVVLF